MADSSANAAGAIAGLGQALAAPGKIVYVSYVILTTISVANGGEFKEALFIAVSAAFWLLQMIHGDYTRIRLNHIAEGKDKKETIGEKNKVDNISGKRWITEGLFVAPFIFLSIVFISSLTVFITCLCR